MSVRSDKVEEKLEELLSVAWDKRSGQVIPSTEDVVLKDGAVEIEATFLYADLAGSAELAKICPWTTTAKIIRAYLACASYLIRAHGGKVRSFDGDRVMGVFIGESKNTNAVRCAREIFWTVEKILAPQAKKRFKSIRDSDLKIKNGIGVDYGISQAVRAGLRSSNDLVWIGAAPSFAAKLSDIREYPYCVMITKEVYNKLGVSEKNIAGEPIWEKRLYKGKSIYRTKYIKSP